ncbi:MAG TPA: AsmA-like C-terminal region-containing protein, partial [Burkholderiaceae bacterium]
AASAPATDAAKPDRKEARAARKAAKAQPKGVPPAKIQQAAQAAPATTARPGHVLPDRQFDIPSLKAMNADVGVKLAVLDLGTTALEPFTPLQARITLQDGVLRLSDILARTSQGQVTGGIGLDSRPALPAWNADLRWSGIQLARFVKTPDTMVKRNADGSRPDTGYVSGALGGDAKLTGTGKSTAALLGSLQGTARLWVQDGEVSHLLVEAAGIDIADALGLFVKGDDKVPMQCAVAKLDIVKGKVLPEVFMIDTHASTLLVGGDLSLKDETLDLQLTSHPHNFSPWAPHGFSIVAPRTPVDVDGTFSDPHVHLEAKPLLVRGGAALALGTLVNPLAALLALVDLRQPEKDVCSGAMKHLAESDRPGAVAPAASSAAPSRARAAEAAASNARHAHRKAAAH